MVPASLYYIGINGGPERLNNVTGHNKLMLDQEIHFRFLVVLTIIIYIFRYSFVERINRACLSVIEFISDCQNGVSEKVTISENIFMTTLD